MYVAVCVACFVETAASCVCAFVSVRACLSISIHARAHLCAAMCSMGVIVGVFTCRGDVAVQLAHWGVIVSRSCLLVRLCCMCALK